MNPMRLLISFVLLAIVILASPALAQQTLRVGVNEGNVPWVFRDEANRLKGFEVDLMNEIAARLGREVEDVDMRFADLFTELERGRIHAAMSSITITDKRLEQFSFTQPYFDADLGIAVRTDSSIKELADLRLQDVGVESRTTGEKWALANAARLELDEVVRFSELSQALVELEAREIDAYVTDKPSLLAAILDKPGISVVMELETGERYALMFQEKAPIAAVFDDVVGELKEEGFLTRLHVKWFSREPEPGSSVTTQLPMP